MLSSLTELFITSELLLEWTPGALFEAIYST